MGEEFYSGSDDDFGDDGSSPGDRSPYDRYTDQFITALGTARMSVPPAIWQRHVKDCQTKLDFITKTRPKDRATVTLLQLRMKPHTQKGSDTLDFWSALDALDKLIMDPSPAPATSLRDDDNRRYSHYHLEVNGAIEKLGDAIWRGDNSATAGNDLAKLLCSDTIPEAHRLTKGKSTADALTRSIANIALTAKQNTLGRSY